MEILHGLTNNSTNEEIKELVFNQISKIRWMSFATNGLDGLPSNRIFDFTKLEDGNIYFITADGKPVYDELKEFPVGMITAYYGKWIMFKVQVHVNEISDLKLLDEFYKCNPGTKALYINSPETVKMFTFTKGQGELLHLFKDDAIARVKFAWGDIDKKPARYVINDNCISCGKCDKVCTSNAVVTGEPYSIDEFHCLECGSCYNVCTENAIIQQK